MSIRFIIAIKDERTERAVGKVRFIVQGYSNKMKNVLIHSYLNARPTSVRALVELAAIFSFRLFTPVLSQAYVQSGKGPMWEVCVELTGEFQLEKDEILKFLKLLYVLSDLGDYLRRISPVNSLNN